MKAAVVTVSDGVTAGTREDSSGELLARLVADAGFTVEERVVVADERSEIAALLTRLVPGVRLIVTTGGTGLGPRDVTPEATAAVIDRQVPGLSHLLVANGLESTPMAALSRGVVGTKGSTLIVNLAGSPRAVEEGWSALAPVLSHALDLLAGDTSHHDA